MSAVLYMGYLWNLQFTQIQIQVKLDLEIWFLNFQPLENAYHFPPQSTKSWSRDSARTNSLNTRKDKIEGKMHPCHRKRWGDYIGDTEKLR